METIAAGKPQHMQALERANSIRLGRAEVKRKIRRGERRVVDILDPTSAIPECLLNMTATELLQAQERWGPTRSRKFLARFEIKETRPLGNLTPRQRRFLVEALRHGSRRDSRALAA